MTYRLIAMLMLSLLVVLGCSGTAAPYKKPPAERVKPVPELNLNLPGNDEACVPPAPGDQNFIQKAFAALSEGDHIEALQYFKSFQRTEQGENQRWEARIGIAYLIFVPASPVHDMEAARTLYRDLRTSSPEEAELHLQTIIMRDSMEAFYQLESQISNLSERNRVLREDLDKREVALKRLRDLTIGS
ncbi:MAG: hypothetical protein ACI9GW_002472 [Halieaceae bacterium]|jgi:hypothetical protein